MYLNNYLTTIQHANSSGESDGDRSPTATPKATKVPSKRSAAQSDTKSSRARSGSTNPVLMSLAQSMDRVATAFIASESQVSQPQLQLPPPPPPTHPISPLEAAIALAEDDSQLDDDTLVDVVQLFKSDAPLCNTYSAIKRPAVRQKFLLKELEVWKHEEA